MTMQRRLGRLGTHLILLLGSVFMLLPFAWMLSTSFKSFDQSIQIPPIWIPRPAHPETYAQAWKAAPFGIYFFNSLYVAIVCVVGEVVFSIFAAYAFARMRFVGKNLLFIALLGTLMIPAEVLLIPNYVTLAQLHWIDTYKALIVPWLTSVFAIFLLRQQFLTIPGELFDAARIDGAGHTRFLWQVMVPLSQPAIVTVALFKFINSWNAFLWVLLVTNTPEMRTVPVGLTAFATEAGEHYNLWMAAATLALIPVVLLFLAAQKQFVEGIARTGLKG